MVNIRLEDPTLEGLQKKIDNYYNNYHPAGYGTHIKPPVFDDKLGIWVAEGTRGSSCD